MSSLLLLFLAVTLTSFPQLPLEFSQIQAMKKDVRFISEITPFAEPEQINDQSLNVLKLMLNHEAPNLNPLVINKVLTSLKCATEYNVDHNNILTIIDYSLPSNEKRFWVFDLKAKKLLFHTYVSHGIKSGALLTNFFSNKFNSKASSIGVYQTQQAYYGRDGLSLRLDGLDRNFNDNASGRSVVMHSGWYVEEGFIKRYGRPGRSWGCPALPLESSQAIINTIKDKSLLVIYYPSDAWFAKSKFLNCDKTIPQYTSSSAIQIPDTAPDEQRDAILFVGSGYKGSKYAESKPVTVISADTYEQVFHTTAPLTRMLRRQINNSEYIALNARELLYLSNNTNPDSTGQENGINAIRFVIPVLKVVRGGYYETQMQFVNLGKIKAVKINGNLARDNSLANSFTVYFEGNSSVNLNAHNEFIRWVGL